MPNEVLEYLPDCEFCKHGEVYRTTYTAIEEDGIEQGYWCAQCGNRFTVI